MTDVGEKRDAGAVGDDALPRLLVAQAEQAQVLLWAENGQLRFAAEAARLAPLQERLKAARAELVRWLERNGRTSKERARVVPRRPPGDAQLSFGQEGLFFLHQLAPESVAYHMGGALWLVGAVDEAALAAAIRDVGGRHEALRAGFVDTEEGPRARIDAEPPTLDVVRVASEAEALGAAEAMVQSPFDLAEGPVFRSALYTTGSGRALLALGVHHVVFDAASWGVLFRDLSRAYEARVAGREPEVGPAVQYPDVAAWQRARLSGEALERRLAFWKSHLEGAPTLLAIPTDVPRPPVQRFEGDLVPVHLGRELVAGIDRVAAAHRGATRFTVLLAAWGAVLGRFGRQSDVVVGCPFAGRTRPGTEETVGYFVQTLPLRVRWSRDGTFDALLRDVLQATLPAFDEDEVPLDLLADALAIPRDVSRNPIFQSLFALQVFPPLAGRLGPLTLEAPERPLARPPAQVDLTLELRDDGSGELVGEVVYAESLFARATAATLAKSFVNFLEAAVRNPDEKVDALPLFTRDRTDATLAFARGPALEGDVGTAVDGFVSSMARARPSAEAITDGSRALSYGELDRRANQLAHALLGSGVQRGDSVALLADRSLEAIVGLLGILRAGAACVPLDAKHPPSRRAWMAADAGASRVVTTPPQRASAPEGLAATVLDAALEALAGMPDTPPDVRRHRADAAVVLYTSGTTGKPKGVVLEHGALCRYGRSVAAAWNASPDDRVLQFASLGFDASLEEMLLAWSVGATLVLRPEDLEARPFLAFCERNGVSVLDVPTAYWRELVDGILEADGPRWPSRARLVIIGGERADPELVRRHLEAPGFPRLVNLYGPTEGTVGATFAEGRELVDRPLLAWIGRPLPGSRVYVLDALGNPVAPGAVGELHLGGTPARGYLGSPHLTAERFLPDPFSEVPGARMYRTGDLARWSEDGVLEFLGRADAQVKIRGFRIEPAEVESALLRTRGVRDGVVTVSTWSGQGRLVAHVVLERGTSVDDVRGSLRAELPDYMVPSALVPLERLPLNRSGKVDRGSLPPPTLGADDGYVAPRSPMESALAGVFAATLGLPQVGIHDDFFTLGGNSLLALRLLSRMRSELGSSPPVRTFIQGPTVAALARLFEFGFEEPPPLRRVSDGELVRPTFEQQAILAVQHRDPTTNAWNMPIVVAYDGMPDCDALVQSLRALIDHFDGLRTWFERRDEGLVLRVHPASDVVIRVEDFRHLPEDAREQALTARIIELGLPPMLPEDPLLHVCVGRTGDASGRVALFMHHAIADAASVNVLVEAMPHAYWSVKEGATLAPPDVRFLDFAAWQAATMATPAARERAQRRREHFAGCAPLELPADAAPNTPRGKRGVASTLSVAELQQLRELAARHRTTHVQITQAIWIAVMHRMTGAREVPLGILHRGVRTVLPQLENLVGFLTNHALLRVEVPVTGTFLDLLAVVRKESFEAYAAADLPPAFIFDTDAPLEHPLMRVVYNYIPGGERPNAEVQGARVQELLSPVDVDPKRGLVWIVSEATPGVAGLYSLVLGDLRVFTLPTIRRISDLVREIMALVVVDPKVRIADLPKF